MQKSLVKAMPYALAYTRDFLLFTEPIFLRLIKATYCSSYVLLNFFTIED